MTPDEQKPGEPPEGIRSGLNDIFGVKPTSTEAAATVAPATVAPDTRGTQSDVTDIDGLTALDEVIVAEMQAESPAVSAETQTALAEPVPAPEPVSVPEPEAHTAQVTAPEPAPAPPAEPELVVYEPVQTPAEPPAPAPVPAASSGVSNDLEEVVYATTAPTSAASYQEGDEVDGYHLDEDLGRGWFSAHSLADNRKHDVFVRPDPLWAGVAAHRLLPKTTRAGALYVVEPMAGPPLTTPVSAGQARAYVQDFARLLFALEKQGFAVTDVDPRSFLQTAQGLKLRFPPRLAKLGEAVEPTLRDGFTPPEVQEGKPADVKSGSYLLGALLYGWLTGHTLPPEGVSAVTLAGVTQSGMPQLLNMLLADEAHRVTPAELLEYLKMQAQNDIPKYDLAAATNIGLNPERPLNEDSYGFVQRQVEAHGASELFIRACVADGMGGMAAGEVASRAAVQGFLNSTKSTLPEMVWDANANLLSALEGRDGGSTFSGVEIQRDQVQLGHVGDTRAYLASGGKVEQISKDHSYVAAMIASGQMTHEEAQHSPDRNKVLRSLGSLRVPQENYVFTLPEPLTLKVGDRLLLVSDGVWGEVEPPELESVLLSEPSIQNVVDTLLDKALASGAPDNITALVIQRVK